MKKVISLLMSALMLFTSAMGVVFPAFAEESMASISYIPAKEYKYIENTNGSYEYQNGVKYWEYNISNYNLEIGDTLEITYTDSSVEDYVILNVFFDENDNVVEKNGNNWSYSTYMLVCGDKMIDISESIQVTTNQQSEHWGVGNHYFTVQYKGASTDVPIAIVENPVAAISFAQAGQLTLTQGVDSRTVVTEDGTAYDYYDNGFCNFNEGDVLTVTYKDNTTTDYTYKAIWNDELEYNMYSFVSADGDVIKAEYSYFDSAEISETLYADFSNYNSRYFIPDNTYDLKIRYLGASCTTPVTILHSNVASITVAEGTVIELTKEENSTTQSDSDGSYDLYYITNWALGAVNCPLTVTKTDGTVENYSGFGWEKVYYVADYDFTTDLSGQQYEKHWNVGETHTVRFWYTSDVYFDVIVKIVTEKGAQENTQTPTPTLSPQPEQQPEVSQVQEIQAVQTPIISANAAASANETTQATTAKSNDNKPSATKLSSLKKGKKSFKAVWKKVSGASGYQIQYSTDKKFKKNLKTVTVKKSKTTSTTVKKLKSNKKYYVRVRTYKNVKKGNKTVKVYSKWSAVKTVKTK